MNKFIFSLLAMFLLSININGFSQECEYDEQSVDKFTGVSKLILKPVVIQKKVKTDIVKLKNIKMILSQDGNSRTFSLSFNYVAKGFPSFMAGEYYNNR